MIITLTNPQRNFIRQCLDDLIEVFGKECRLVYPASFEECINCVYDSIGQKSANIWRTGGPVPFPNGSSCPMCGGTANIAREYSDTVKFSCEWNFKKFIVKAPNIRDPYSVVQTRGYLTDVPKIKRAEYMVLETPIEPLQFFRFKLLTQPVDYANLVQGRYFLCLWEQI